MSANANIKAGRAYVEVTAETSKLKENLSAAQAQLRDFGRACQGLGKDMMALGSALTLPFALAERSFAGFDDKMRLVQAVTSSTGEQFEALTKTAQRLGRETSFTAQQVADAMIGLGRMGFDPSEITSAIANVLDLSRATGTDLAESADIAANALRMFGLEAGKMSQVADVLTATANGSAQTLADLFEGLKRMRRKNCRGIPRRFWREGRRRRSRSDAQAPARGRRRRSIVYRSNTATHAPKIGHFRPTFVKSGFLPKASRSL